MHDPLHSILVNLKKGLALYLFVISENRGLDFQKSKPAQWKPHRDDYILDVVSDPLRYNKLDGIYYN